MLASIQINVVTTDTSCDAKFQNFGLMDDERVGGVYLSVVD